MYPCQGDNANVTLRAPSGLQEMFRQNNTNRRFPETAAPQMRDMQSQDSPTEGEKVKSKRRIVCIKQSKKTRACQMIYSPSDRLLIAL